MTEISKVAASGTSGPYPGVPASAWKDSEKPLCDCHGEAMRWHRDSECKLGGRWRCAARHRERKLEKYHSDPVHAELLRERSRRWYEANIEKERERGLRWYHDPANNHKVLAGHMRASLRYHAQRLIELEEKLGA